MLPDPARAEQFVIIEGTEDYNKVIVSPTDMVTLIGGAQVADGLYGISAATGNSLQLGLLSLSAGQTWTGLTELYLGVGTRSFNTSATLRITKQGESFLSSPVVLPTNDGGPIEISVETSTDSINWVPAAPGIIPTGSDLGFWRLKAEVIED